ncbi:MAG: DUF1800 family protein, partial [Planctomycetota bacterium]|nr:DUF1800 family protein [Planctomycetota bacterium]
MLTLAPVLFLSLPVFQDPGWDHRSTEHLLNRAGFGANSVQVEHWVEAGQEALVEFLLKPRATIEPWEMETTIPSRERLKDMEREERQKVIRELRRAGTLEANNYLGAWIGQMVDGKDPLGDRMTLFWQGFFTSSLQNVRRPDLMVR